MPKRIFEINFSNVGSTGGIMLQIAETAKKRGYSVVVCCPDSRTNRIKKNEYTVLLGNRLARNIHLMFRKNFGFAGLLSFFSTLTLIKKMKKGCDLVHLHNIHGDFLNYPLLFNFLKKNKIPVIWTFHDCWPFTGRCPYFDLVKCEKWIEGCHDCAYPSELYPESKLDSSKYMWRGKRKWFTGLDKCVIVTPSQWLANHVKKSFFKDYQLKVINNGIDLSVFKPIDSDFRLKYGLNDRKIVLGVAFGWGYRKGLDVFIELSKRLPSDYQIILVGTNSEVDKSLPRNIISIHRTHNRQELVKIYSAADVFVNPTREENYPTVNMEAIACGTPVITFRTGGSPEIVDENSGIVVSCNDVDSLEREIYHICSENSITSNMCTLRSCAFRMQDRFNEYVDLYDLLLNGC